MTAGRVPASGDATALQRLTLLAAGLSAVASLIHGAVTEEHFEEWWGYGVFFVVAAIAQMLFAVILVMGPWRDRRDEPAAAARDLRILRLVALLGIVGNGLVIALYVVTRTIGIPLFGPEAGEVEAVGAIDLVSKLAELALIGVLVWIHRLAGGALDARPSARGPVR